MPNRRERNRLQEQRQTRQETAKRRLQQRNMGLRVKDASSVPGSECAESPGSSFCAAERAQCDLMKKGSEDLDTDFEAKSSSDCIVRSDEDDLVGDTVECLICMEEIGDERPLADVTTWDLVLHRDASPQCLVLAHVCGECLDDFVNKHERDPERTGSFPCPVCRVGLRVPFVENIAQKTCLKIERSSAAFQHDCSSFLEYLDQSIPPSRNLARDHFKNLLAFVEAEKDSIAAVQDIFKSKSWYVEACRIQKYNRQCYKKAKLRYREIFPKRPEATEHEPSRATDHIVALAVPGH